MNEWKYAELVAREREAALMRSQQEDYMREMQTRMMQTRMMQQMVRVNWGASPAPMPKSDNRNNQILLLEEI